jgi:hypothetical protein
MQHMHFTSTTPLAVLTTFTNSSLLTLAYPSALLLYTNPHNTVLDCCTAVEVSKGLEQAVSQLSLCSAAVAQSAAANISCSSSSSCKQQQQLGVLAAFDLGLLRYQERDALLETFQRYQHKVCYICRQLVQEADAVGVKLSTAVLLCESLQRSHAKPAGICLATTAASRAACSRVFYVGSLSAPAHTAVAPQALLLALLH